MAKKVDLGGEEPTNLGRHYPVECSGDHSNVERCDGKFRQLIIVPPAQFRISRFARFGKTTP